MSLNNVHLVEEIISFVLYAQKRLIFSRRVTTCFAVGSLCILRTRERGAEDGGASLSAFRRGWRWLSARLGCGGSCWDIFSDPVPVNSHAPLREGALGIKQGKKKKEKPTPSSVCVSSSSPQRTQQPPEKRGHRSLRLARLRWWVCMHVFCTVRAEKTPKIHREHLSAW